MYCKFERISISQKNICLEKLINFWVWTGSVLMNPLALKNIVFMEILMTSAMVLLVVQYML